MLFYFTLWAMTSELMLLELTASCESRDGEAAAFRWKRRSESIFRLHPTILPLMTSSPKNMSKFPNQTDIFFKAARQLPPGGTAEPL